LSDEQATAAHQLAERYVQDINRELSAVPSILSGVAGLPCVRVFAFDDEMLDLANQLAFTKVAQKPFDHAILAGILVAVMGPQMRILVALGASQKIRIHRRDAETQRNTERKNRRALRRQRAQRVFIPAGHSENTRPSILTLDSLDSHIPQGYQGEALASLRFQALEPWGARDLACRTGQRFTALGPERSAERRSAQALR